MLMGNKMVRSKSRKIEKYSYRLWFIGKNKNIKQGRNYSWQKLEENVVDIKKLGDRIMTRTCFRKRDTKHYKWISAPSRIKRNILRKNFEKMWM